MHRVVNPQDRAELGYAATQFRLLNQPCPARFRQHLGGRGRRQADWAELLETDGRTGQLIPEVIRYGDSVYTGSVAGQRVP
jgi:hypothetical protein